MNKEKHMFAKISVLQALYWLTFCSISGFATVYLLSQGLNDSQVGIIIAVACLISVVFQSMTGFILDKFKRLSVRKLIIGSIFLTIVVNVVLILFQQSAFMVALMYCLAIVFLYNVQPLITTLIYQYINNGEKLSFSFTRGIGSFAYAATSFFLGRWLAQHSSLSIPLLTVGTNILLLLLLLSLPEVEQVTLKEQDEKHNSKSFKELFQVYPSLLTLITSISFIFIFHTFVNVFLPQIISRVGGSTLQVGYAIAIAGFVEIPVMLGFQKIESKLSVQRLLCLSATFFFIRSLIYYFALSFAVIIPAQLLQFASFAILTPAYAHYINESMQEEDQVKGQTIVMAAVTLGNVLGSFIGGQLITYKGVQAMLLLGIIISFIGLIFMFISMRQDKSRI